MHNKKNMTNYSFRLMARIAEDEYRLRTIITEGIASYLFTHRRVEE